MSEIAVSGLSVSFGDVRVLKEVTFKIAEGKITGFLGPNGAGKTTIFNAIAGDIKPDKGWIRLRKGEGSSCNLLDLQRHEIARVGIGYLYQIVKLFPSLTVMENVKVALFNEKQDSPVWDALHFHKLKAIRRSYEDQAVHWLEFVGLYRGPSEKDVLFKKMARELSYGQQKLLSLAQLMARGADILLLDEPTAGVNEYYVRKIEDLILKAAHEEKKTIGVIEHNIKVLERIADLLFFLSDGEIVFFGKADHVLGNEDVRRAYIGLK